MIKRNETCQNMKIFTIFFLKFSQKIKYFNIKKNVLRNEKTHESTFRHP